MKTTHKTELLNFINGLKHLKAALSLPSGGDSKNMWSLTETQGNLYLSLHRQ